MNATSIVKALGLGALCLALIGTVSSQAFAEDKLELRLRLKKGDVYHFRLTVEQHVVQTPAAPERAGAAQRKASTPAPPAPPQAIDQTLGIGYTMSVDAVGPDGAMTLSTRYDSVLFRKKGPAGSVEYDSANPPPAVPPSAKPFSVLPGLGFRMTLTPDGTVRAVEGLDEMFAEMVKRLELPDGPARQSMLKALTEQFGEAAMKQNLQNLFALYPPAPVAVGEKWERKVVVSKGFPLVIQNAFTLKGRSGGVAEVAIDARLLPNPDAAPVEMGTGRMSYALSGEQHGSAKVDEASGWTRSLATEQDVSGSLTLDTPGDKDAEVPISLKSKIVIEPVEGK